MGELSPCRQESLCRGLVALEPLLPRSPWPVVADVPVLGGDPDGYDGARVAPILEFVGDRPFAWVEDELSRQDASALTADYECLLLRPNPRRGISRDHLDALWAWASDAPSALEQR